MSDNQLEIKEAIRRQQPITTSCKDCVFAIYNNNTQTGCTLGRIQKYLQVGVNILECYDDEKEFYVVDGRRCVAVRNHKWAEHNNQLPSDTNKLEKLVRKENELNYESFIYIEKDVTIDMICATINSLLKQEIKPKIITLVRNPDSNIDTFKMVKWFRKYMEQDHIETEWRVESPPQSDDMSKKRCLDIAIKKNLSNFYSIWNAGFKAPKKFHGNINRLFFDELERFIMLEPYDEDLNGLFVIKAVHDRARGNQPAIMDGDQEELTLTSLREKVNMWAQQGDFQHMIREASNICPM